MEFSGNREIKHCLVKRTNKHRVCPHMRHLVSSFPCEHTHAHENAEVVYTYLGLRVNFFHTSNPLKGRSSWTIPVCSFGPPCWPFPPVSYRMLLPASNSHKLTHVCACVGWCDFWNLISVKTNNNKGSKHSDNATSFSFFAPRLSLFICWKPHQQFHWQSHFTSHIPWLCIYVILKWQ